MNFSITGRDMNYQQQGFSLLDMDFFPMSTSSVFIKLMGYTFSVKSRAYASLW